MSDILAVDMPDVDAPDAKDGVSWLEQGADWVTGLSGDAWKIIVILVVSALLMWLVRRSQFLKGAVVVGVLLFLAYIAFG